MAIPPKQCGLSHGEGPWHERTAETGAKSATGGGLELASKKKVVLIVPLFFYLDIKLQTEFKQRSCGHFAVSQPPGISAFPTTPPAPGIPPGGSTGCS